MSGIHWLQTGDGAPRVRRPLDMRPIAPLCLLLLLAACPLGTNANPPPAGQFYYPTGLVHVDSPQSTDGVLFVANSNWDKRWEAGSIMALNLGHLGNGGLPPFGQAVPETGPKQIALLTDAEGGQVAEDAIVEVQPFSGYMAAMDVGGGVTRLFVPSRSENMRVQAVDYQALQSADEVPRLSCATPEGRTARDCGSNAPSLDNATVESSATGIPRAPAPYGVAVGPRACAVAADCALNDRGDTCEAGFCTTTGLKGNRERVGDVYFTHVIQADSPYASATNLRGYLVHLDSSTMSVAYDDATFINLGNGASDSVAVGRRWSYVSGRYTLPQANLLRLVDNHGNVFTTGLEATYRVLDSRGVALSSDERRLYVATRSPDSLLVVSIDSPVAPVPSLHIARGVPLLEGPNAVVTIPRPGRSDLVAVTCTGAGAVALYDDDLGNIATLVPGVGLQPFALAVDRRGVGARLFVSDFGDGRIAVIDVPDLGRPQDARLVAHLGVQQLCITRADQGLSVCDGGVK